MTNLNKGLDVKTNKWTSAIVLKRREIDFKYNWWWGQGIDAIHVARARFEKLVTR